MCPRPCDGRRPSSLLAQAPPRVCANTYTLHRPPTAACTKGPGADVGKQEALPFGVSVGVGAHRACDDEDGAKHVHESWRGQRSTRPRRARRDWRSTLYGILGANLLYYLYVLPPVTLTEPGCRRCCGRRGGKVPVSPKKKKKKPPPPPVLRGLYSHCRRWCVPCLSRVCKKGSGRPLRVGLFSINYICQKYKACTSLLG